MADWKALKANAPTLPPETCGLIDIIGFMIAADGRTEATVSDLALRHLETLRAENDALRRSSHYWYKVAKAGNLNNPERVISVQADNEE